MASEHIVNFRVNDQELKLIQQRAAQEGVSRGQYLKECVYLEFVFSGDLEATKFVVTKVGKRIKDALVDRVAGTDVKAQVEALAKE